MGKLQGCEIVYDINTVYKLCSQVNQRVLKTASLNSLFLEAGSM